MSKSLFPTCASFGPTFMALAFLFPNRGGLPYGLFMAVPGALMTSAAMLFLFRMLTKLERVS